MACTTTSTLCIEDVCRSRGVLPVNSAVTLSGHRVGAGLRLCAMTCQPALANALTQAAPSRPEAPRIKTVEVDAMNVGQVKAK